MDCHRTISFTTQLQSALSSRQRKHVCIYYTSFKIIYIRACENNMNEVFFAARISGIAYGTICTAYGTICTAYGIIVRHTGTFCTNYGMLVGLHVVLISLHLVNSEPKFSKADFLYTALCKVRSLGAPTTSKSIISGIVGILVCIFSFTSHDRQIQSRPRKTKTSVKLQSIQLAG